MSFDEDPKTFSDYEAAVIGERRKAKDELLDELIEFVHQRIEAEVAHRPDVNVNKAPIEQTWNQMLRELLRKRGELQ